MKLRYEWSFEGTQSGEANPNEGSFILEIRLSPTDNKWHPFVNGEELDDGPFDTRQEALLAAESAYEHYYADFENPTDGF